MGKTNGNDSLDALCEKFKKAGKKEQLIKIAEYLISEDQHVLANKILIMFSEENYISEVA